QEDVNLLFGSIINSSDGSPINLESHPDFFERYHLKDSSYYQVIICGIDSTSDIENSEYVNERYQLTFEWLQSVLVTLDPNISILRNHCLLELVTKCLNSVKFTPHF